MKRPGGTGTRAELVRTPPRLALATLIVGWRDAVGSRCLAVDWQFTVLCDEWVLVKHDTFTRCLSQSAYLCTFGEI